MSSYDNYYLFLSGALPKMYSRSSEPASGSRNSNDVTSGRGASGDYVGLYERYTGSIRGLYGFRATISTTQNQVEKEMAEGLQRFAGFGPGRPSVRY